jgi:hypothetical protein
LKKSSDIEQKEIFKWLEDQSVPNAEIQQYEDALNEYATAFSIEPPAELREKILKKLHALQQAKENRQVISLDNLPILDEASNWLDWQEAVAGIHPPESFDGIHLHSLESSDKRELFVAWVKEYVEEEVHTDLIESFILLEGTCECHISSPDGKAHVVRMAAGDFIRMNLGEVHDVVITSLTPAKAILQWMKVALVVSRES